MRAAEVAKKARKIGELYVKAKSGTSRGRVFGDVFLVCVCVCVFASCLWCLRLLFHGRRTHSAEAPRMQILPKSARRILVITTMDAQTASESCPPVNRDWRLSISSFAPSVATEA